MKITTEDIYALTLFERTRRKLWPSSYQCTYVQGIFHSLSRR